MTRQLTPADISAKINGLDRALVDLEAEAAQIALAATEGDAQAAARLAQINGEIDAMKGDREILQRACRAAESRAFAQDRDEQARERAAHLASARTHAAKALKGAQEMDKAISAFVAAAADLDAAEAETRRHLRLAGENPSGRVGREGASAHGMFLLARIADGTARRRNDRTVAELVGTAWRELLQEETADA